MAYTGYKIIQYIDDNPNSSGYGETWTERVADSDTCPTGEGGEWMLAASECEMTTSGFTGYRINTYYNNVSGEYSSTTVADSDCQESASTYTDEEIWVNSGSPYCEVDEDGIYTGWGTQLQVQKNFNLPNYGEVKKLRVTMSECSGYTEPQWEDISTNCHVVADELTCYLTFDGTADILQIDTNQSSPSFNKTRTITGESEDCYCELCDRIEYEWRFVDDICGIQMPINYGLTGLTDDTVYHVYRQYGTCIIEGQSGRTKPTNVYSAVTYQTGVSDCVYRWVDTEETVCDIYDSRYFTTVARDWGHFFWDSNPIEPDIPSPSCPIQYSLDSGATWTTIPASGESTPYVSPGTKVYWKGNLFGIHSETSSYTAYTGGGRIGANTYFDVEGNIMSLVYNDDFIGKTSLEGKGPVFALLFYSSMVVDASDLSLPAITLSDGCYMDMFSHCPSLATVPSVLPSTTLADGCYGDMFSYCTSLTTAPALPATTLSDSCYSAMFQGCTSLTTAPVLPATTLTNQCYYSMFEGCTSLTTAPELPATTLASSCYLGMFQDCTSLSTVPSVLPATELKNGCYQWMFKGCTSIAKTPIFSATTVAIQSCYYMFSGCTSLTTAYKLPATNLNVGGSTYGEHTCYSHMFDGCTSLRNVPSDMLPATTLSVNCYSGMFQGCTSLTTAPELNSTELEGDCYKEMFSGCTSLNYIKCMVGDGYVFVVDTDNWVAGVASSGTFVKNALSNYWSTGVNGIPTNWTVINVS